MKKGTLKHFLASALLILPLVLQAAVGVQTVAAADTPDTVNITLHKLAFDHAVSPEVQNDGETEPDALKAGKPLEGATFAVYDVTDQYQQLLQNGKSTTDAQAAIQKDAAAGAPAYAKPVNAAAASDTDADAKGDTDTPTKAEAETKTTDQDGLATFSDLPATIDGHHAVYLFVETSSVVTGQTTIQQATPLVVALPLYKSDKTTVNKDIQLYPKNVEQETATKDITNAGAPDKDGTFSSQIGAVLNYSIKAAIPADLSVAKYDKFDIKDTPDKGLAIDTDSIKVTLGDTELKADTDYKLTASATGFSISLLMDKDYSPAVLAGAGKTLNVTYNATITKDAAAGLPLDNQLTVTPGNNPGTDIHSHQKPEIGEADFKKQDVNSKKGLTGAEFEVKNSDGKFAVQDPDTLAVTFTDDKDQATKFISGEDGLLKIQGLPFGDYTLTETKAPEGYVLSDTPVTKFTVSADSDYSDVGSIPTDQQINNTPKGILPHTGGMGIYILIVIGLAVMGGAFFFLKKGSRHEEV